MQSTDTLTRSVIFVRILPYLESHKGQHFTVDELAEIALQDIEVPQGAALINYRKRIYAAMRELTKITPITAHRKRTVFKKSQLLYTYPNV